MSSADFRTIRSSSAASKPRRETPEAGETRVFPQGSSTETPPPTPQLSEASFPRVRGFEIISLIGRGGMGMVYKARHLGLHRIVALKTLNGATMGDAEAHERFQAEAEAVARLQHPNIIQVFEIGAVQSQPGELTQSPFIALEFIDGGSLSKRTESPQPFLFSANMVEKLARAAYAAHSLGVVHRDLKPANVLLTGDGEPKVADFGVAKLLGQTDRMLTQAGMTVGTPEYMAPEQAGGEEPTPAVDIYSLGVILYELLTARLPFQGSSPVDTMCMVREQEPVSPRRLRMGLPRDLETICMKCLEKAPARRYHSAEALADDLALWAAGKPIHARPAGPIERSFRWAIRNPAVAVLSILIVLVASAGLSGVIWKWRDAETQARAANERAVAERWERYRADIIAASSALQLHDAGAASRALNTTPTEHRNWEWQYLSQQLDGAEQTLKSDGMPIKWMVMSRGGESLITIDNSENANLWDLKNCRLLAAFPKSPYFRLACFSPNGRTLAHMGPQLDGHTFALRDLASGHTCLLRHDDGARVGTAVFSKDGTRLATSTNGGVVRIWEADSGRLLLKLQAHGNSVGGIVFSPDDRLIATAGLTDRSAKVWDARTGKLLLTLIGHDFNLDRVQFNPAGDRILTSTWFPGNKLWLWEYPSGKLLAELKGHQNQLMDTSFSKDGKQIATASRDQTIRLWDGRDGKLQKVLKGHSGGVNRVSLSGDGRRLVSASEDKTVRLWNVETGETISIMLGHSGDVQYAAFTSDGNTIVSASFDGTIKYWDARRVESDHRLRGHSHFVYSVAFHPDGQRVASASWDGTARIWNANTGKELLRLNFGKTYIVSVAFHPKGKLLATLGRDDAVRLWDAETGLEVHKWSIPTKHWQDSQLAFSPDGAFLAMGDKNRVVHLWNVPDRSEAAQLTGHQDAIRSLAFSPDSRWLATGAESSDRTVRIWDTKSHETAAILEGHTAIVYALAFNRAGTILASGSTDGTVRLWDTRTWKEIGKLMHGTNVYSLAFTPDGKRMASGCADNTIRFWDVERQEEVAEFRGHSSYVHSIAFSPDGTRLVSGSGDGSVRIWDTLSPRERKQRPPGLSSTQP